MNLLQMDSKDEFPLSEREKSFLPRDEYGPKDSPIDVKRPTSRFRIPSYVFGLLLLCLFYVLDVGKTRYYSCLLTSAITPFGSSTCSTTKNEVSLPADTQKDSKDWPVRSFKTESFKSLDLKITKTAPTAGGYLFFGAHGGDSTDSGPVIMSNENDLIWHGPPGDAKNIRVQHLADNTPVLTWWQGESTATFGHGYGPVHIVDQSYEKVAEICLTDVNIVTPGHKKYPCYQDMHESYITDRDTILLSAYNVTMHDLTPLGGSAHGWLFDSLFYEVDIKTGKVLFEWSALKHMAAIPLEATNQPLVVGGRETGKKQALPFDWFHINSVQSLEDGYLVNARHTFSFYKLDKKGKVEWTVEGTKGGDFKLERGIHFSWQHQPRVLERHGSRYHIELFNNDNSESDHDKFPTTGLDLTVDVFERHVSLNRNLQTPEEPLYARSQGSIQSLPNGNVLMGYGQVPKIREYTADGDKIFEAQFGVVSPSLDVNSYRAYRHPWRATPLYKPKIAGQRFGALTNAYVSWNGATEVEYWIVYGGNSSHFLSEFVTSRRMSFETVIPLNDTVKYVQAVAMKGDSELQWTDVAEVTD